MITARMAVIVVLSSIAILLVVGTAVVRAASTMLLRRLESRDPISRANHLFLLRVMPGAMALFVSGVVILPAFLWLEPGNSQERIPTTMIAAAGCGCLLLLGVAWRTIGALSATRRLLRTWQSRAQSVANIDAPIPAYSIDDEFPTVAVIGLHRPILFMSAQVLRECSPEETRAMILHECAHVGAHDNIRRLLLRACPDLFGCARAFEKAWEGASEEAADAVVARQAPHLALSLAQALVRVGRLAPEPLAGSASALYSGGSIESRVRRLLSPPASPLAVSSERRGGLIVAVGAAVMVMALLLGAPAIHQIIEILVATLP